MKIFILTCFISFVGFCSGVKAEIMGSARTGLDIASQICAECYSVTPDRSLSPNVDAPSFKEIANIPGMSVQALYVWMRSPHPTMPNLALEFQDEEDLFAYILSLKDEH